jgi:uncharacterized protein YjbJ (UPF0337 family)
MNKDRIQGSVEQAKGKMKSPARPPATASRNRGKAQRVSGKVQNAIGGFRTR